MSKKIIEFTNIEHIEVPKITLTADNSEAASKTYVDNKIRKKADNDYLYELLRVLHPSATILAEDSDAH